MSGSTIAYHLRQNKAIERNLFIDLLRRVGYARNISDYQYIGFGGPFMEDFKLLHNAVRITDMHSIERDKNTHLRQKFNRPTSFVQLHNCDSRTFFDKTLNTDKNSVVWLDYATPKELGAQFTEFLDVASKLGEFDIIKVTLNANPASLGKVEYKNNEQREERLKELSDRLGEFLPASTQPKDLLAANYPDTLQKCIRHTASFLADRAVRLCFRPLASFTYSDGGHTMLTVTGIILNARASGYRSFLNQTRMKHWEFNGLNWKPPIKISVPTMSIKERLKVEEALPLPSSTRKPADRLKKQLGFWPCNESDAILLENYAKFYRSFPYFSKVNPT